MSPKIFSATWAIALFEGWMNEGKENDNIQVCHRCGINYGMMNMISQENLSTRLLWIVNTIFDPPDDMDAEKLSALEDEFCDSIDHPGGAALLHYPAYWGLGDAPSAQEIVKEAISWKPRIVPTANCVSPFSLQETWLLCV
jgi:hypothetical protein